MYNVIGAGLNRLKKKKESRSEVHMIVNGKVLLNIIREDGPKEDFDDPQEYENDCFNVAKLLLFLLKTGTLRDYLGGEEDLEVGVEIKNQIKRACNIYGIRL
jgi:hypothetical protein|tara:strand:+ start:466 stop:771 length:306 start_codon:yes stop_codon:yes gene_type:complete